MAERSIVRENRGFHLLKVLSLVEYPGWTWGTMADGDGRLHLRVECHDGRDNRTGEPMAWNGRWWRLSEHMTDGEVVQTAFLAVMTALEHEAREAFTYRGVTVFDPHYDIEKLVELRRQPDAIKGRTDGPA